jgi:hypothetical protein
MRREVKKVDGELLAQRLLRGRGATAAAVEVLAPPVKAVDFSHCVSRPSI